MNNLIIDVSMDTYQALERLRLVLNSRELLESRRENRDPEPYNLEAAAHYALCCGVSWLHNQKEQAGT